jgi:hypothetical protein
MTCGIDVVDCSAAIAIADCMKDEETRRMMAGIAPDYG